MHPKVRMFLEARDNAIARGDRGITRAMTAELDRLGVPATATLAHPNGAPARERAKPAAVKNGRPKPQRCEHDNLPERCAECNPELLAT